MKTLFDIVIVIPVYNEQLYIKPTLKALSCQKIPSEITWSVVFVDNNSTDNTVKLIREHCNRTRIPYKIIRETKQGTVYSRIQGLMYASRISKDIILSTDADTTFPSTFVETTIKDMNNRGSDVLSGKRSIPKKIRLWRMVVLPMILNTYRKLWNLEYMIFGPYFFGSHFAIRTNFFKNISLYNPPDHELYMGEDILLSRRCYYMGASFSQSSTSVISHSRKNLVEQETGLENFIGNNLLSHTTKHEDKELRYTPLNQKQETEIQNKLLDIETKRFLWTMVDALQFWEKTGHTYPNALNSAQKSAAFSHLRFSVIKQSNIIHNQNTAYMELQNKYFIKIRKKISDYLHEN